MKSLLHPFFSKSILWIERHPQFCLFLYFALISLALCALAGTIAPFLTTPPIHPLPGVIFYIPQTQAKLITYALCIPSIFVFWGCFLLLVNTRLKNNLKKYRFSAKQMLLQLLWGGGILILCYQLHIWYFCLPALLLFFIPAGVWISSYCTVEPIRKILCSSRTYTILFCLLFAALLIRIGVLFGTFVFKPLYINNEFLPLSSIYTVNGAHPNSLFTQMPDLKLLTTQELCFTPQKTYILTDTEKQLFENYLIFSPTRLCLIAPFPAGLLAPLKNTLSPDDFQHFLPLYTKLDTAHQEALYILGYPSGNDLLKDNLFQYHWQVLARGFLHHHNHLFGSAYQFILGRPLHEIFMQYGLLHTVLIGKLLSWTGEVSYSRYVHLYYAFYFLYFGLFLSVLWLLFKNRWYVLAGGLLTLTGWLFQTYLYLYLGPGTNPARYMLYLLVLGGIYGYIKYNKQFYIVASLFFTWLAISFNTHFGLFTAIALSGVLFVKILIEKNARIRRFDIFTFTALFLGSAFTLKLVTVGPEPIAQYFFSGLLGFSFNYSVILYYFLAVTLCYGLLIWKWKNQDPLNYSLLFMTFFSQGVFIYYLRSAGFYHFCAMSSVFILQGILALFIFQKSYPRRTQQFITTLFVLVCLFVLSRGQVKFHKSTKFIRRYFQTHELYKWDLPGTGFLSTMNPADFLPSVNLIHKYKTENGIYLLSQYDNFLPILAQTYNKLPFIDAQWYLTTQKEYDLLLNTFKKDKPEYLFVETDFVTKNPFLQVIPKDYPLIEHLHSESVGRAQRLNLLGNIFRAVQQDYELIETSNLISVYKRKENK